LPAVRALVPILLALLAAPLPAQEAVGLPEAPALEGVSGVVPLSSDRAALRPRPRPEGLVRCWEGDCVAQSSYASDVCRLMEKASGATGLDAGFFARLLWAESRFDATAVSPVGAQGIAQFMPGTAALRGLADPFNPAEAIWASATYLRELEGRFGSLGLAAVAYNAGEARAEKFLAGNPFLPQETRNYVRAITGLSAEAWREGFSAEDLSLDPARSFAEACLAKAEGGGPGSLAPPEPELQPWGVVLTAQGTPEAAQRVADEVVGALGRLLEGERVTVARQRLRGSAQWRHVAQVGRGTRIDAEALCEAIRGAGRGCIVLRN
jgi:hypothetical protein